MGKIKKVLFIQHANVLSGSCISLLLTMNGLDKTRYTSIIALADPNSVVVRDFYFNHGYEPVAWLGVRLWHHSTGGARPIYDPRTWKDFCKIARDWASSVNATTKLVQTVAPDLVHLNSMCLSPCAAG